MTLNPFFLQGSTNEQFLIQDIINEQLRIYGIEVYYLPRKIFKTDDILKEIQSSRFDDIFLIEAYLNNFDGYAPDSDIMTKFGLRLKNEISLTISRERYEEFIAPFLEGISSGIREGKIADYDFTDLVTRPREGDLVYFPLGERLFEIKRVESEKPFYQLGTNYVYELSCELYEYENELINTTIEEVDNTVEDEGYLTNLILIGSGTEIFANATAGISSGAVSEVFLNNDGSGYTSTPTVTFSPAPFGGRTATAVAITTSIGNVKSIYRIEITDAGSGYLTPPSIVFSGPGTGAAATCSIGGTQFSVSTITVNNSGRGYVSNPIVTIEGPSIGVTATAVAITNSNTGIDSFRILNPGIGYTSSPEVTISGFSTVGVGTFVYNEIVTGQLSGTTARVRDFRTLSSPTPGLSPITSMRVSLNTGKFSVGETIVGSTSSARYVVKSHDLESYDNPYDANEEIEIEADGILDFTESNPFGEY